MSDVFEVQDEIARKIAEALRITLSPQEQEALAAKPTENLQAYDLYLRGRSYARRLTRQDMEFALQMFENAVTQDPNFALAYAAIANVCAHVPLPLRARADAGSSARARPRASARGAAARRCPRSWSPRPGSSTRRASTTTRSRSWRERDRAQARLRGRVLPAAARALRLRQVPGGRRRRRGGDRGERHRLQRLRADHERARRAGQEESASATSGSGAIQALENHLREVPEDARARILLRRRSTPQKGRTEDAIREANLAMTLRPNEATVLYNAACTFCQLGKKAEALDALQEGLGRRLQGRRLGAARSRPRAPPRRPGVREALPHGPRRSLTPPLFAFVPARAEVHSA